MVSLLLAAAIQASSLPQPINPEKWLSYTDYPQVALGGEKVGTTWFELSIDETGKPYACNTILSSGVVELDRKSCAAMLVRGHFQPAQDQEGRPVPGTLRKAASWSIPPRTPPRPEMPADLALPVSKLPANAKPAVVLRLVETVEGAVEDCGIEKSTGSAQLDRLACSVVSRAKMPKPLIGPDGAPTRAVRIRRVDFKVAP